MGYDIGWVVLGDEPLRMDEIEALQAHVSVWKTWIVGYDLNVSKAPQDRIQAYFSLRPERRADAEKIHGEAIGGYAPDVVDDVFDAMAELRDIMRRHEVVVHDDFFSYRWSGRGWKESKNEDAPTPRWADPNWVAIGTLEAAQLAETFADRPLGERPAPTKKRRKPFSASDRLDVDDDDLDEPPPVELPVEAPPKKQAPAVDVEQALPELIAIVLADRAELSPEECARYGLKNPDSPSTWAVRDSIGKQVAEHWAEPAALYLLAGADRWAETYGLSDLTIPVFERARELPAVREQAVAVWSRTLEQPTKAYNAFGFFRALAPVLLDQVAEILRAPLPSLHPDLAALMLDVLSAVRSEDALAILVACIRRDRHHPGWPRWREKVFEALERLRDPWGVPSALLELADCDLRSMAAVQLIATERERGISLLERLRDCAGFLDYSIEYLEKARDTPTATVADTRKALLDHPFWKARLMALRISPYSLRAGEAPAVRITFEGADAEPTDYERERCFGDLGPYDRERFLDQSRENGFFRALAPLPPAVEGLASRCADHRSWALSYVDRRCRAEDAAALVLADELDLALASRGHTRTIVVWSRWNGIVPASAAGRAAWARERLDTMPAALRAVAEHGAEAVATTYPSGRFTLTSEEREHYTRIEQDIAARGDELLTRR